MINAAEKGADLTLSGTTTNVRTQSNRHRHLWRKNYTASVASDGSWTAIRARRRSGVITEAAPPHRPASAISAAIAPRRCTNYSIDSSAPTIIINTVASDNIVNASEADAGVTVSGSTTAEAGQIVTVTLNSPTDADLPEQRCRRTAAGASIFRRRILSIDRWRPHPDRHGQ
ncbi:hypothetical protein O5707_07170 [Escherichia coli]|nr:hypothetical protein [Escherichia coli]